MKHGVLSGRICSKLNSNLHDGHMHMFKGRLMKRVAILVSHIRLVDCFCESGSVCDKKHTTKLNVLNQNVEDVRQ